MASWGHDSPAPGRPPIVPLVGDGAHRRRAGAVALAVAWRAPVAIAWVNTGRAAHLTVVEALKAIAPASRCPPTRRRVLVQGPRAARWVRVLDHACAPARAA